MSKDETPTTVKDDKPKAEKKPKAFYFRNKTYSGAKIYVRGGEDELGQLGIKEQARFMPYYDTWKGDTVRVGYLRTESAAIAKRCQEDRYCEEIDEKEYNQSMKELRRAPIPVA